jgi:hypothetical protein
MLVIPCGSVQNIDSLLHISAKVLSFDRNGEHNVVDAFLPAGQLGTSSAAAVASQMKLSFASILFGLIVGIGGGVPCSEADIRLDDAVISQPYAVIRMVW